MQRKSLIGALVLATLAAAVPASRLLAQPARPAGSAGPAFATGVFAIDPVHSAAVYRTVHMGSSAHWGMIKEPTGTFELGTDGSFKADVTIEIAKLDSANAKRDEHLKGPDFFNAKQFPQMTFKSTESRREGDDYVVKGDLTIKGQSKPIEVTFKKVGEGKGMKGETLAGFETEFTVKRTDYDIGKKFPEGVIGNDVKVIVSFEGAKQ